MIVDKNKNKNNKKNVALWKGNSVSYIQDKLV